MSENRDDHHLIDLVPHVGRLLTKALGEVLRPFGLTPAQYDVLEMIWERGDVQPRHIIAERGVESASVGTTLTRLERDGWIVKVDDPKDGRGKIIKPTKRAVDIKDKAREAVSVLKNRVGNDLTVIRELKLIEKRLSE